MTQRQFNSIIRAVLAAREKRVRAELQRLDDYRSGDIALKRVRVKAHDVPGYRVNVHYRVIAVRRTRRAA